MWSPDGECIATGSVSGRVRVWDAVTGGKLLSLKGSYGVESVVWSPDGERIAAGSSDGVWVWDAVTGEELLSLKGNYWVESVAWSPDGKRIAAGSNDGVWVWDAVTGEQTIRFIAALPEGESVVLSADQTKVIGASAGAWRWLGRLAVLPDGKLERIPVEIDGPLPPLGPDAEVE